MKFQNPNGHLFRATLALMILALALAGPGGAAEPDLPQEKTPLTFETPPELVISKAAREHLLGGRGDSVHRLAPIEVRWSQGSVLMPDGRAQPVSLHLALTPGPTLPVDGNRVNLLAGVSGELAIGSGLSRSQWVVEAGNFGEFFAKTHYLPESGELWIFLPVVIRHEAQDGIHGTFSIFFQVAGDKLSFDRAGLWDFGRDQLEERPDSRPLAEIFRVSAGAPLENPAPDRTSRPLQTPASLFLDAAPAAFEAHGDGDLLPLTEIREKVPGCEEEGQFFDLRLEGGRLAAPSGAGSPADLQLRLTPGPSYVDRQGSVRNLLLDARGLLTVGEGEAAHTRRIALDLRRDQLATTTFAPKTGHLRLTLPVVFDDPVGSPVYSNLSLACTAAGTGFSCSGAELQGEVGPWSRPLEGLLERAGTKLLLGRQAVARATGLDALPPNADDRCESACPNCVKNGCNGFCAATPTRCSSEKNAKNCCMGNLGWACRLCTDQTCTVVGVPRVLSAGAETVAGAEGCPFTLARMEELAPGERFLMEEWAVVTLHDGSAGRVSGIADASALDFARTKAACLADGRLELKAEAGEKGFALLIDHTVHPMNERHIPTPSLRFETLLTRQVGPEVHAAVRFQVDTSRKVRRVDLLHADGPLPKGFLKRVEDRLEIVYETERSHWLSVYAVFRVANGTVELDDFAISLPQCCDECPPPPYHCN